MQANFDSATLVGRVLARSIATPAYPASADRKSRPALIPFDPTTQPTTLAPIVALRAEAVRAHTWENALWLALGLSAAVALFVGFWI